MKFMNNLFSPVLASAFFLGTFMSNVFAEEVSENSPKYWQTLGYGYVIEVVNDTMTFYDVTEFSCVINTQFYSDYKDTKASQWISTDKKGMTLLDWYAVHPVELQAIEQLPALCDSAREIDPDPVKTFEVFWAYYSEHFPYGEKQNWHWDKQYPIWRSMVDSSTSNTELAEIFSLIINRIRDGHAELLDADGESIGDIESRLLTYEYRLRRAWKQDDDYRYFWPFVRAQYQKWQDNIAQNYVEDREVTSYYDNFHFARLKHNLSYLRIDEMAWFSDDDNYDSWLNAADDAMQKLLPKIKQSNGLVIDLRGNGGGTDLVSLRLLSYLFQDKTRIAAKATVVKGVLGERKPIWVTPAEINYDGPIVVLTSQGTASAAEIMLLGLTARENTILLGEPSNGSFSDILPKQLPNGWGLGMSNQVYFDASGIDHEEVGIPVDEFVPFLMLTDLDSGRDPAIELAISKLLVQ